MQKAVIRLKTDPNSEIAKEEIVETYLRPIRTGTLLRMANKNFSLSTEFTPMDVKNLCISLMDAYNQLYQQDNVFNSMALAQFCRVTFMDLMEMAMHERIVAQCTTSVGEGLESMIDQLIEKGEEIIEICDQIISMKNGKV